MAGTNKLLIRGGQVYDHDGDNLTRPHPRQRHLSRSLKMTASGQHQAMSYENGCSISELQPGASWHTCRFMLSRMARAGARFRNNVSTNRGSPCSDGWNSTEVMPGSKECS